MSKTVPTPRPGFDDLSVEEQIDFVQSLCLSGKDRGQSWASSHT